MTRHNAVCLLSGGLDSAVTAFLARDRGYQIYALSFRYGQRHTKELSCAKKIATTVHAHDHLIFDVDLSRFGHSSLLSTSAELIRTHRLADIGHTIPSTYVPARNTVFLSLGLAYAETIGADAIFIGVNALDYSGYPDCRPEYIDAFQHLASLATKRGIKGKTITIEAPLLHFTKAEIIQKGVKLHVPFQYTWSCYRGGTTACGRCDSCLLRLKGFQDAHHKDPLAYHAYPPWYQASPRKKTKATPAQKKQRT
ncbi:MAG: 7-cyano-7-deazaguanine synthase QueC [Candidatus Thermoplasmatota archaeon]|nr:7-cyano-7-deazaguanine synthase QueC [Candidatus Thermoplasmatota archaeon]